MVTAWDGLITVINGPVISPYISKTFYGRMSYFVIMSQCETFFDPKINVGHSDLCLVQWFCIYILKTIWWMNVKLWHTDSMWHNIWPKHVGHSELYFMVQWFCLIFWRLWYMWISYFVVMSQYDTIFDLKIPVCVCVNSGLTSLSTNFQSYHDGVWLRQGTQCSLL